MPRTARLDIPNLLQHVIVRGIERRDIFNLRHNRASHLFQNRYKSLVCDEDPYLLELVRYSHLNPLRVSIVPDLDDLDWFAWPGHFVLMGKCPMPGQNTEEVLRYFERREAEARRRYRSFVEDGVNMGKRAYLVAPHTSHKKSVESRMIQLSIRGFWETWILSNVSWNMMP